MPTTVKRKKYLHTPDYMVLLPPGEILSEKMSEMGIGAETIAERCNLSLHTIQELLSAQIAVTPEIAKKLEVATQIPAKNWMRHEEIYRIKLAEQL